MREQDASYKTFFSFPEMVRDLLQAITNLIEWLKLPDQKNLRRAFTRWIYKVFIQTRYPKEKLPEVENLEEARTMLSKTVVEWTKQWKKEGVEKGRQRMASLVLRQLESRFGPLPEAYQKRVLAAKPETLERWGDRLMTASTLRGVFKH